MMSWKSHDPQANTNSTTAQYSTFSMEIVPRNFTNATQFASYPIPP